MNSRMDPVILQTGTRVAQLEPVEGLTIGSILAAKEKGCHPDLDTTSSWSRQGLILVQQWELLEIHDKLLRQRFHHPEGNRSRFQLLVPTVLQKILGCVHRGGVSRHSGQH